MNREEVLEVLNFRHACKEFDPNKKISSEDFEVILESGRLSPSSMGIEPWNFIVVENQELKDMLGEVCWGGKVQIPTCSHLVIYLSRKANEIKSDSKYIDHILKEVKNMPEDNADKFKGVMKSLESNRFKNDKDMENYSNNQVYIALANMMTSAAMLKIDSCAIGGIDYKSVEKILTDKNLFDSEKFNISLLAAFGYRINEAKEKQRQSLKEIVTFVK